MGKIQITEICWAPSRRQDDLLSSKINSALTQTISQVVVAPKHEHKEHQFRKRRWTWAPMSTPRFYHLIGWCLLGSNHVNASQACHAAICRHLRLTWSHHWSDLRCVQIFPKQLSPWMILPDCDRTNPYRVLARECLVWVLLVEWVQRAFPFCFIQL